MLIKIPPPAEFEFEMLQVQMSLLPDSPPMTQLPAIQWNHFCISGLYFTVYLSVNPQHRATHGGCFTVWEKKIERYTRFFFSSMPLFAAIAAVVTFLWESVVVT